MAEKKSPRTASPEIRAMNKVEAILETLDPQTAERVARYAYEKARQRDHERIKKEMGDGPVFSDGPPRILPNRVMSNV